MSRSGLPIVVAAPGASPERALEWFRRGAADCVTAQTDFDEVLASAYKRASRFMAFLTTSVGLGF